MRRRKKILITSLLIGAIVSTFMFIDIDSDKLLNYRELFQTRTNPFVRDTDFDGLSDGEEIERWTNPLLPDTDGDGILDGAEVYTYGTNPLNPDTDGDGLLDCESFPLNNSRPTLEIKVGEIDLVKKNWKPFVSVSYDILADGLPLNKSWVHDSTLIVNRLAWNNFHILINNGEAQFELGFLSALVGVDLEIENNVKVRYLEDEISKRFTAKHADYRIEDITAFWNGTKMSIEQAQGDLYASMQKAFDDYATVISAAAFLRKHLKDLKNRFTSLESWYQLLAEIFRGASMESVWNNIQRYANVSGTKELLQKVYIELAALSKSLPDLYDVARRYPNVMLRAIKKVSTSHYFQIIDHILMEFDELQPASLVGGSSLEKAIDFTSLTLQEVYSQLGSDFFGWVNNASSVEQMRKYAYGAQWYMDNLVCGKERRVIRSSENLTLVREDGVAWWVYNPFPGFLPLTPFVTSPRVSPSSFPSASIIWIEERPSIFPPSFTEEVQLVNDVFLATESIVLSYLQKNGFRVRYMPPTEEEKSQFKEFREISKYYVQELDRRKELFLNNDVLATELTKLSNAFANFDSISDSISIVRKYGSQTRFLEELNNNTWLVVNT